MERDTRDWVIEDVIEVDEVSGSRLGTEGGEGGKRKYV